MSSAASPIIYPRLARLEHPLDCQDILDCLIRLRSGMVPSIGRLFPPAFHSDAIIDAGEFVVGRSWDSGSSGSPGSRHGRKRSPRLLTPVFPVGLP